MLHFSPEQMLGPVISGCTQQGWLKRNRPRLKEALQFWKMASNLERWEPLRPPPALKVFYTDSSTFAWGAHTEQGVGIYGSWSEDQKELHINHLEILAVAELLKSPLVERNSSIKVFTDSYTAFLLLCHQ